MPFTEVPEGVTPGASFTICLKSRPFIGRSCTAFSSTTATSDVDVVSRDTAEAETSTTDCCWATPNWIGMFVVLATETSMRPISLTSKPGIDAAIR